MAIRQRYFWLLPPSCHHLAATLKTTQALKWFPLGQSTTEDPRTQTAHMLTQGRHRELAHEALGDLDLQCGLGLLKCLIAGSTGLQLFIRRLQEIVCAHRQECFSLQHLPPELQVCRRLQTHLHGGPGPPCSWT